MATETTFLYLIYQTTNLINGKIYVGKHKTFNREDGYMGSGKHLKRAIAKYGSDNFQRVILFELSSEQEMNTKEAEVVTEEFVARKDTYNICVGGQGGFSHINLNEQFRIQKNQRARQISNSKGAHIKGSAAGIKWRHDNPAIWKEIMKGKRGRLADGRNLKSVIDEFGMQYDSVLSCAEAKNVTASCIRRKIKLGKYTTIIS